MWLVRPDAALINIRVQLIHVSACELANGHGCLSGQLFDVVIRCGHMANLVVRHRATEMLDDVRRNAHCTGFYNQDSTHVAAIVVNAQYSTMGKDDGG